MKTQREEMLREGSDVSTSQGLTRIVGKHQKLEEASNDSPLKLLERTWPC